MYTTPICKYCKVAKDFFQKKGISFEEFDITKNKEAMKEMINKSRQMTVPVFDIEGRILVGFKRSEIEEAIKVA